MKRKVDIGLAALIVLAFFAAYLLWRPAGPDMSRPLPAETPGRVVEEDVGIDTPTENEAADTAQAGTRGETSGAEPARRIVLVPPPNDAAVEEMIAGYADLAAIRAEKLPPFVRGRIDEALAGDIYAAFEAREARSRCSTVSSDPQRLEQRIEWLTQRARFTLDNGGVIENEPGDSPGQMFPTAAENRAHQVRWFQACHELRLLYEQEYRDRIEALAREGHVVARYLYALWPPPDGLRMDDFLDWQEWQSLAHRFSMENLEAGESAGMLAFAQAYSSVESFLPRRAVNSLRAIAFYLAALECGFREERVRTAVNWLISLSVPNDEPSPEQARELSAILTLADELKTLCR